MVIGTATGKDNLLLVLGAEGIEVGAYLLFRHGVGEGILPLQTHTGRDVGKEVINAADPNLVEHLTDIVRCVGDVFVHGE